MIACRLIARKPKGPATAKSHCVGAWQTKGYRSLHTASSAASDQARFYVNFALADKEREVFIVMLLDAQHGLIEGAELFRGTVEGSIVYPREVVNTALLVNAAAVMSAHNHPRDSQHQARTTSELPGDGKQRLS